MSPSSRTRYYSQRNGLERDYYQEQNWSGRESYERTRRERLERLRQEDLNWRPRGSQGNSGPSRGAPKRQSFFCRVCNVTSMSREMHDKHERSRKHLDNAGREEDELFSAAFQNSEENRGDGRKGRRRSSDDSDIVIIEDQSAKISDKKREATQSFEDKEEDAVEKEEKEGDCTDCLRPMGEVEEHMRKNHQDLFLSCKLCLQVNIQLFSMFVLHFEKFNPLSQQAGYSPYLVLTWDELGEHLRSMHSKPENETKNPDLPFFAKVSLSWCFANVTLCYPGGCVLIQRVSLLQPLPPKYFLLDNRWVCESQEGWCVC